MLQVKVRTWLHDEAEIGIVAETRLASLDIPSLLFDTPRSVHVILIRCR
jgi:hypothetical protein